MKRLLSIVLVSLCSPAIAQTDRFQVSIIATMQSGLAAPTPKTWYVRKDGGTRKTCDGKADAAPVGAALNQHCAFGDYRFLYDDQSGKPLKWVMAGGDKVILKDGPWRVGFNQGKSSNDVWGRTGLGPQASEAPPVPAGTAAMHTQILGENFASCSSTNKTQLFGGFGLYHVLSLAATSFVDVECIELTRHSQCIQHGDPMVPGGCSRDFPFDDYAVEGVVTDQGTHDVLMQDSRIAEFSVRSAARSPVCAATSPTTAWPVGTSTMERARTAPVIRSARQASTMRPGISSIRLSSTAGAIRLTLAPAQSPAMGRVTGGTAMAWALLPVRR